MNSHHQTSTPKSLYSNAFWNVFGNIWSVVVVFFLAPFLISHIGESRYGLYLLLVSISGFLSIMNLGLGEATLRFVALYLGKNDQKGVNRVFQSTLFVYFIMATIAALFICLGSSIVIGLLKIDPGDVQLADRLLKITAIAFWIRFLAGPFIALPQAAMRYDILSRINIFESIIRVLGSVTVVLLGFDITGLIFWNLILSVIIILIYINVGKRIIPYLQVWPKPSRAGLKEVFSYGIFAFISQLFGMIWMQADRMMLGALVGTSAVAFFTVPQNIAFRALDLAVAAGAVLMPKFSRMQEQRSKKELYIRSSMILVCVTATIFVPLTVMFKDFLKLWITPAFAGNSANVGLLIAGSCIVRGAFIPYESLFRGIGKPQYYLVLIVLSATTIVIADITLIPVYGLMGAGYSFCLSPLWGFAAIFFAWRFVFKEKSLTRPLVSILVPIILAFLCLGLSFQIRSFFPDNLNWILLFLASGVIFIFTGTVIWGYESLVSKDSGTIYSVLGKLIHSFKSTSFSAKFHLNKTK